MFYVKKGSIPRKRHIQYPNEEGSLFFEEHISREGFSSIYSNVYHYKMPTEIVDVGEFETIKTVESIGKHKNRHYFTSRLNLSGDAIDSRELLFFNEDLSIYKLFVDSNMDYLYRNSHFDELFYIQSGKADFISNFGSLELIAGDYLVIPKGVIWKIDIKEDLSCLLVESRGPIEAPSKYINRFGQFMEHSPFCERDIVIPKFEDPIVDSNMDLKVRLQTGIQNYILKNHPFDIVGWDGYYYPWKFNIQDFEPITGSIHQPPPVHQTFQANGFVVCSFVSRLFDYHPKAIPSPYPHSNVDSDEVIFYSMGDFMSRNGIEQESITFHPAGITHGPHPGKYEGSIGKEKTEELAVMIDTFKPLKRSNSIKEVEDNDYSMSWNT
tara:strand:- start:603 stop:1745 length:1143 start_codon:yes stop_codon:yes gene_type:complete